ncbi:amino acid ABC transporter permease [Hungatella hathewayi]|uniref:Amino acid ABC transporter permease n=1 Tax=Hungatella hathewayi TaxID=154046 RepID=A0A3E2WHR7_9FIRM|nr:MULTISPECIES: amino acid ABC transporter permease [Clostridia]RGC25826.1 amino acid ABC transporter permease [Hungatella hathewayi]GKH34078.1 hypothetical protein CE91St64_34850 [Faecalicatena contorta]
MSFYDYANLTGNDAMQFLRAARVTLYITFMSLLIGTIVGVILGLIRCSRNKVVSVLPLVVIEPLRNSPLVTQLFLVFYGLPMIGGIMLDPFPAAILALSLNTAAFMAVLVHNSVSAIPEGQWEAGMALGHSRISTFINVISRQALRLLVPQAITLYISQLQCSSLVALIGIMDLTKLGQNLALRTLKPFLIYGIVFLIYYVISSPLSRLAKSLEKKLSFHY